MSNFILAGLYTEGVTDVRFLKAVVKNALDDIAFECKGDIETDLEEIKIDKAGLTFNDQVFQSALEGANLGAQILFVHTDADDKDDQKTFKFKINPAKELLNESEDQELCKNLVPIVPVFMTESWMLADKELLKNEIGIEGTDTELGLNKNPEEIKDPKATIESVIRLSKENKTKRKRSKGLDISDLYQIIGQKINLAELEKLPSYLKFKENLKQVLIDLNFLHQ